MHALLLFICYLASTAISQPTQVLESRGQSDWSTPAESFYSAVDNHIANITDQPNFPDPPSCDLAKALMPAAPTPLPSPGPGQVLRHVAIGRGTQNYTCSNSSASVTPVAIGAIANLYNASCVAANHPGILSMLPNAALQYPVPSGPSQLSPDNITLSGHHFFQNTTTPVFNLDTTAKQQFGLIVAKKVASSNAPTGSPKGQAGLDFGSVTWLYLQAESGTTNGIQFVYRLNTAGGNPPQTCEGMPAMFTVQYAAEYWFFGDPTY